ncbi:MAG: HU family DNA-binding protein [Minisyncoccia bacterium]|jgi:DNA-binding protein HU-beta
MNKEDLIEAIVNKINCTKKDAQDALETIIDSITKALSKGDDVALTGFGSFTVKHRAARNGVNPKTGEKIKIAAAKVPKFKAGKGLKDAVK